MHLHNHINFQVVYIGYLPCYQKVNLGGESNQGLFSLQCRSATTWPTEFTLVGYFSLFKTLDPFPNVDPVQPTTGYLAIETATGDWLNINFELLNRNEMPITTKGEK